jgi:hypothetical protein
LGLSSTTDKQKEAAWHMEFEALGEQSVLKNVKQGVTYNEAKRQAAFRWLSEQASCGTAAKHGPFSWHGGRSLYQWRRHLSASWVY